MVEGYVTDIAPGLSQYDIAARFPNGVPAVSEESMTEWMQYVWMQYHAQPIPQALTSP